MYVDSEDPRQSEYLGRLANSLLLECLWEIAEILIRLSSNLKNSLLFYIKSIDSVLISPQKHKLLELIRSTWARFSWENKEQEYCLYPLLSGAMMC